MPLYANGLDLIRTNLEQVRDGKRPRLVAVGCLTEVQLMEINLHRKNKGLPEIVGEIVFDGRHVYASRCVKDGYTIEDVLTQIESAFSAESIVQHSWRSTTLLNRQGRSDGYGHIVRDEAVFECTSRHPNPELYSVAPKGDGKTPHKTK